MSNLLCAHPDFTGGGETDIFDMFVGPLYRRWQESCDEDFSQRSRVGLTSFLSDAEFDDSVSVFLNSIWLSITAKDGGSLYYVDKTPSHALYLDVIHHYLPEAKIIHMLRDPRDVIASMMSASTGWGQQWAPSTVEGAYKMWEKHVYAARKHQKIWGANFHEIRFEDLYAQPHHTLGQVFEFLKCPSAQTVIDSCVEMTKPTVKTRAEEPKGFFRTTRTGTWVKDLSRIDQIRLFFYHRHQIHSLGYPWTKSDFLRNLI